MRHADTAWLALAALIVAYEVFAAEDELLSEGWDRYLVRFPLTARVAPLVLTLHVINALPDRFDLVHQGFVLLGALKGKIRDRLS